MINTMTAAGFSYPNLKLVFKVFCREHSHHNLDVLALLKWVVLFVHFDYLIDFAFRVPFARTEVIISFSEKT